MSTSTSYRLTESTGTVSGTRIHRGTCKRAGTGRLITSDDADFASLVNGAVPATCCKPKREEIVRLAQEAKARHAESERQAADSTIKVHAGEVARQVHAERAARGEATKAGRPSTKDPRLAAAMALRAAGKRGKGKKVTDDELTAYCRQVQAEHGTALGASAEGRIAYWSEGMAMGDARFARVWDAVAAEQLANA